MRALEFSRQIRAYQLETLRDAADPKAIDIDLIKAIGKAVQEHHQDDAALQALRGELMQRFGYVMQRGASGFVLLLLMADRTVGTDLVQRYADVATLAGDKPLGIVFKREDITKSIEGAPIVSLTIEALQTAMMRVGAGAGLEIASLPVEFVAVRAGQTTETLFLRLLDVPELALLTLVNRQMHMLQVQFMLCALPNFIAPDGNALCKLAHQMQQGGDPGAESRLELLKPMVLRAIETLLQPSGSKTANHELI